MVRIASMPASVMGNNLAALKVQGQKRVKVVSESDLEQDQPLMPFSTKPYITIYDANRALHFNIDLARNYRLNHNGIGNVEKVCRHNAKVASRSSNGIPDLNKAWMLVSRLSNFLSENDKKTLKTFNDKVDFFFIFADFFFSSMQLNCLAALRT